MKLKPCAHCGGEAEEITAPVPGPNKWVKCSNCGIGTRYHSRPSAARRIWNARISPAKEMGARGGRKSRRSITTEQQANMQAARTRKIQSNVKGES